VSSAGIEQFGKDTMNGMTQIADDEGNPVKKRVALIAMLAVFIAASAGAPRMPRPDKAHADRHPEVSVFVGA
jgi:hypothetical protein